MAQTATQDDDLLIIEDSGTDSSIEEAVIDINLDGEAEVAKTPATEDAIDFGELSSNEETKPAEKVGESVVDVKEEESSIDLELWDFSLETEWEPTEIAESVVVEETANTDAFDLDLWSEAETPVVEKVTSTEESFDAGAFDLESTEDSSSPSEETSKAIVSEAEGMNVILTATVTKLQARKEAIVTEKDGKKGQVTDIEEQIKKLEAEKELYEGEIKSLEAEGRKITTNIKSLEKMKLDDSVKEHNSKRVLKK